jgi:hypothetical protein
MSDDELDVGMTSDLNLPMKVKGVVPVIITYAAQKTNKTPQRRISSRIQNQKVDAEITDRWNNCQGKPFLKLSDENGTLVKAKCSCCSRKTSWHCIECNAFFCMQVSTHLYLHVPSIYFINHRLHNVRF